MGKRIEQGFVIHVDYKDEDETKELWATDSWPVFIRSADKAVAASEIAEVTERIKRVELNDVVVTPCPATLSWVEPTNEADEYCHCRCHNPGEIIIHCQACCAGKCWKCDRPIKNDLEKHMEQCQDFNNPQKLYDDLAAARKEIADLKGKNDFLNTVYKAIKEGGPLKKPAMKLKVVNWYGSDKAIREVGLVPDVEQNVTIDQIVSLFQRGNSVALMTINDQECLAVDEPGKRFSQRG